MNRKALAFASTCAVLAAIAALILAPRPDAPAPAASKPASVPKAFAPVLPAAGTADSPLVERARTNYRVHEEFQGGALGIRAANYSARVTSEGLRFENGDRFFQMRAASVEQGGVVKAASGGSVSHPEFGRAAIDRAGFTEEYVFENRRAEQLFRIAGPVGPAGALKVRIDMESNHGPAKTVYKHAEGWKDAALWNGGIVFGENDQRLAYHSAVAIDAVGKRAALQPRLEHNQIVLEVPEAFMASASYPLVVDPFLELDFSASGGGISLTTEVSDAPAMIIDGGGNPIVAWSDDSSGNFEIYVRRFNGLEWVEMGIGSDLAGGISGNDGRSTNPSIASDNTGSTVAIAWQDDTSGGFEIYCKVFTVASGAWANRGGSASGGGISSNIGESLYPTVALTSARVPTTNAVTLEPIVAWQDTSSGTSEIYLAWFHPGDIGDAFFGYPPVASGWYCLPTSGSGDFISNRIVTQTAFGVSERPKLVLDSTNHPIIVWQDTVNGISFDIYATRYSQTTLTASGPGSPVAPGAGVLFPPAPGIWTPIGGAGAGQTNVSSTGGLSLNPGIAISSSDSLLIAWQEFTTNYEVYLAQVTSAGAISGLAGSNATVGLSNTTGQSVAPSVGVSGGGLPTVAWQDDTSGNPEIYVRRFTGAAWAEVGVGGSAAPGTPAGISNTPHLSLTPVCAVDGFGDPVVAWMDGADGKFEVYLKRFFSNAPFNLRQRRTDLSVIAPGGFTFETTVQLVSDVMSELAADCRVQVEVRPIDTPFTGTPTAESGPFPAPASFGPPVSTVVIPFSGLANVKYHWRARTVDVVGRSSAWISFGGNLDGVLDVEVQVPSPPISVPTGLNQLTLTTSTPIAEGGATTESSVVVTGVVTHPTGGQVILDVEHILIGPGGPAGFSQIPTISSGAVASGSTVTLTLPSMNNGNYRWAAQTRVATSGLGSGWVEFGTAGNIDFVIGVAAATPAIPSSLAQFESDGTTVIALGAASNSLVVIFSGNVLTAGSGTNVRLDVEVQQVSVGFTGVPTSSSGFGAGGVHTVSQTMTIGQSYHWRARAASDVGTSSGWLSFGSNADGQTDFAISTAPTSIPPTKRKERCGLTGAEVFVLLGAAALLRRRGRKA